MYCPSCGSSVKVNSDKCTCCGLEINKKLFELEPEKTEADIQKNDILENKKFAIAAYFGPFVIFAALKSKKSPFARFHGNQGLIVFVLYILSVLIMLIPGYGKALGVLTILISLSFSLLGAFNASKGEKKELPIVGKIKILKEKE